MLSTQDNELLCRVGPGTPMGEFMREYWLPAFVPSELPEADGEPRRMRSGGVVVPTGVNGLDAMADLLYDRVLLDDFRVAWEAKVT